MGIGTEIIDLISSSGLVRVSFATKDGVELDNPVVVFVWSANAADQIEAFLRDRVGDTNG